MQIGDRIKLKDTDTGIIKYATGCADHEAKSLVGMPGTIIAKTRHLSNHNIVRIKFDNGIMAYILTHRAALYEDGIPNIENFDINAILNF